MSIFKTLRGANSEVKGFGFESREEEVVVDATVEAGEAEQERLRAEVAEADVEVVEEINELEQQEQVRRELEVELERVEDSEVAMEAFMELAVAAKQNGGLSAREAALLNVGIHSAMAIGGARTEDVILGMENYGGMQDRVSATQYSIESIKDRLKQAWEWIKKQFAKIKDFIVKGLQSIFGTYERIEKKAKAIKERAVNIKGSTDGKLTGAKSLYVALSKAGSELTPAYAVEVSNSTGEVIEMLKSVAVTGSEETTKAIENIKANVKDIKAEDITKEITDLVNDLDKAYSNSSKGTFKEDVKYYKLMPGNYAATMSYADLDDDIDEANSISISYRKLTPANENVKEEVAAMKAAEVIKACNNIISNVSKLRSAKAEFDKAVASIEKSNKAIEATYKSLESEDESGEITKVLAASRALAKVNMSTTSTVPAALKHHITVLNAVLDYSNKSLNTYKEAK